MGKKVLGVSMIVISLLTKRWVCLGSFLLLLLLLFFVVFLGGGGKDKIMINLAKTTP